MEGIDFPALERWMDRQAIGHGPIADRRALAGGTQNILVQFSRGEESFVLRRPPLALRSGSNATMMREARMLAAIAGSAVPHPRLLCACADEAIIGAAFYLMTPVDGFNATAGLPALHANDVAIRHRIGLAMVDAIAALGMIDYRAVGLDGFGKPENFLERQVDRWKTQLAGYADIAGWPGSSGIPGVEEVGRWLEENRPASFTPGLMHGDFHLSNVMIRHDSGEVAAVVDWELSTIGDPLLDLGWLIATWPETATPRPTDVATTPWEGFASPQELVDRYAATSGRELGAINWYVVLACYKLGIVLEGTYARSAAGHASQDTGARFRRHTVDLFERALRRIA